MAIDLSNYQGIQTNLFVNLKLPSGRLKFSDYHKEFDVLGIPYQPLGELLSVTTSTDDLRATPKDITMTISGIPTGNVDDVLDERIKGSFVTIYRGFFDAETAQLLNIADNPAGKFQGIVSNFQINDDIGMGDDTGTFTIVFTITSIVELLNNKVNGRRTNPVDFPAQQLMSRVGALAKSNFNFGAPK
jgi:hypothetical protein